MFIKLVHDHLTPSPYQSHLKAVVCFPININQGQKDQPFLSDRAGHSWFCSILALRECPAKAYVRVGPGLDKQRPWWNDVVWGFLFFSTLRNKGGAAQLTCDTGNKKIVLPWWYYPCTSMCFFWEVILMPCRSASMLKLVEIERFGSFVWCH